MTMKSPEITLANQYWQKTTNALGTALATIAFISLMGWHTTAEARIYKCIASDGSTSYSQSECPYNVKTAKVMSSSGRGHSNTNCSVADEFLRHTAETMRSGTPSGQLFKSLGGFGAVSPVVVSMINYIYTFAGNLTTTPERIHELAMQKCSAGTFGAPTCRNLPAEFANQHNSCAANSGNAPRAAAAQGSNNTRSNSNTSTRNNSSSRSSSGSSSSQNSPAATERERRRAERRAQRMEQMDMEMQGDE